MSSSDTSSLEAAKQIPIRRKSEDSLNFKIFAGKRQLRQYLVYKKKISDIELGEIQSKVVDLQKKSATGVNYYTIILGELLSVIDQFTSIKYEAVLSLDCFKQVILKFEKVRNDFLSKVQGNEKVQGVITLESIRSLELIFNQLRFILTRFGRVINFIDALVQARKRKQLTSSAIIKLQAPVIKRILAEESIFGSDSDQNIKQPMLTQSPSSNSSLSSSTKNNKSIYSTSNETRLQRETTTNTTMLNKYPIKGEANLNNVKINSNKIKDLLEDLSQAEKSMILDRFMHNQAQVWKDEYEEERKQRVPLIICRLCYENFYADRVKEHSLVCEEKIKRSKEQTDLNLKFLDISNQLTEQMVNVQKTNVMQGTSCLNFARNTPRLPSSRTMNLLQTPTLRTRVLTNSNSFHSAPEEIKQSPLRSNEKSKSTFAKNAMHEDRNAHSEKTDSEGSLTKEDLKEQNLEETKTIEHNVNELELKKTESRASKKGINLVPMLNFNKLSSNQLPQQTPQPLQDPFQKLQMISGKHTLPTTTIETPHSTQGQISGRTSIGLGGSGVKTAQLLRGLESARAIKNFENIKSQTSFVSTGGGTTTNPQDQQHTTAPFEQPKDQKDTFTTAVTIDLPKTEETKEEILPTTKQVITAQDLLDSKFPLLKPKLSLPIKEVEKITPKKNYFAALTTMRQKDEVAMKGQQEKNEKPKPSQQEEDKKSDISQVEESKRKISDISSVNLPQSPYLYNVRRRFDNIVQPVKPIEHDGNRIEKQKQIHKTQITSPFINLHKGMTKEERKEHIQRLKQHVDSQIMKEPISEKDKKDFKLVPISNAFTLNIKNEREAVMRNMENLRKSVKLKKRANPFEKILTKLIIPESIDQFTPNFTDQTKNAQNQQTDQEQPQQKANVNVFCFDTTPKSNTNQQQQQPITMKKPSNQLQSIDEDIEDEQNAHNSNNMGSKALIDSDQMKDQVDKKLEDIGLKSNLQQQKQKKFSGMSPMLTFRPLCKLSSDQSGSNTPLDTPQLLPRSAMTSRELSTQLFSPEEEELQNAAQMLQLQSAKKEQNILENLKTMAKEIYNIGVQIKQCKTQLQLLKKYMEQLQMLMFNSETMSSKTQTIVNQFIEALQEKINALEQLENLDRQYQKTMPRKTKQQLMQDEKIHKNIASRKINTSLQTRESIQKSPQKIFRKPSAVLNVTNNNNIFFPQGFANSPTKELTLAQQQENDAFFGNLKQNVKTDSQFKSCNKQLFFGRQHGSGMVNQNFSDISQSPISYPSDSPFIGSTSFNDRLSIDNQKMMSATPLIQSRASLSNLIRNELGNYQNKVCGNLSISQISSPQMREQLLSGGVRPQDLHSIEEEKGREQEPFEKAAQVIVRTSAKEPRRKSHFSQQKNTGNIASQTASHKHESMESDAHSESQASQQRDRSSIPSEIVKCLNEEQLHADSSSCSGSSISGYPDNYRKESYKSQFSSPDLSIKSAHQKGLFKQNSQQKDATKKRVQLDVPTEEEAKVLIDLPSQKDMRGRKIFHHRNYSYKEGSTTNNRDQKSKSPLKKSQFQRPLSQFPRPRLTQPDSLTSEEDKSPQQYNLCQSDIVVGNNFNTKEDWMGDSSSVEAFSDYHEMFFVNELFKDSDKFDKMLEKRAHNAMLKSIKEGLQLEQQHFNSFDLQDQDKKDENDLNEEEDEDDVLTMDRLLPRDL